MLKDIINTQTSKDDLSTTLRVIREFKSNESNDEWIGYSFESWFMLERLEQTLAFLVGEADSEDPDTIWE